MRMDQESRFPVASSGSPLGGRLARAIGANFLRVVLNQVGNVLLVPLFLHSWGSAVYGEWLVLWAAVGSLTLLDLGMQTYVVNRMCQAHAQGRLDDLHRDLHSSLRVYLVVVGVGLLAMLVAVTTLPLDQLLNLRETDRTAAALTLMFLSLNTVLVSIPVGLIAGLYRASGAYTRGQMIGNGLHLTQLVLTASLLMLELPMTALAASRFLMDLGGTGLILWELRRFRPEIEIGVRRGTLSHGWSLMGPGLLFFVMSIAALLNVQGTLLVLNGFLSAVAVAQFSTTRTLANLIAQSGNTISAALWPEVTAAEARGEVEHLRRFCLSLVKLNVSLAVLAALLLRVVGPDFYRVWTQRQLNFDSTLLDIFLLQVVLMAFWSSSGLVLLASNRQGAYAWWTLGNAIVTIALSFLLAPRWGAAGVAAAGLLGDVVCALWVVPRLACRFLGEAQSAFWTSILLPGLAIGGVLVGVSTWLASLLDSPTLRLLSLPPLIVVAYALVSYGFWMTSDERRLVRSFPRRLRVMMMP